MKRSAFHRSFVKSILAVSFIGLGMSSTGCQFSPKPPKGFWSWKKEESKPLPDRILAVWTDSVLHQPNQPGVRGFGGRIYFYEKEENTPIEVDGSFAVYVFDANNDSTSDQKPLRKFVFTADQFATHMSKTSLGPSYSVWLPWEEVGGPPMRLSLISRFEGRTGGTTLSDSTIKLLPGVGTGADLAKKRNTHSNQVQLASHRESPDDSKKVKKKDEDEREVETIELPPGFQRHLQEGTRTIDTNTPASLPNGLHPPPVNPQAMTEAPRPGQFARTSAPTEEQDSIAPMTTQVYDYRMRSRKRFGSPSNLDKGRANIRDGRWIESIARGQ